MNATQGAAVPTKPQEQSQIIIIKDRRESLVSRSIGYILGQHVVSFGAFGFLIGLTMGHVKQHSFPLLTGMIGGAIMTTVTTLGVTAIQMAADFAVNAAIYAVKLPIDFAATVLTKAANGVQSVYHSTQREVKEEELSSAEALAKSQEIA